MVFIGLGANLDNPVQQVRSAITELNELPETRCVKASQLYRSVPMGTVVQDDFINSVAQLETFLSPQQLLIELQTLEQRHHRTRKEHWGPRTLDLDLLLYGEQIIDQPDLQVPHSGLAERNFVLIPLYEIAPDLLLPDNQKLADLAKQCGHDGLECLE
jgi:2-amino-4-hydroxy-6-hydroxymethyldihydropteridine diphosphokinase